jgi:hypothetical protein
MVEALSLLHLEAIVALCSLFTMAMKQQQCVCVAVAEAIIAPPCYDGAIRRRPCVL